MLPNIRDGKQDNRQRNMMMALATGERFSE
jgi:hypothetical protein